MQILWNFWRQDKFKRAGANLEKKGKIINNYKE